MSGELSREAGELLRRVCAGYAAQPWNEEAADKLRPPGMSRSELLLAREELSEAGLLASVRRVGGERLYGIPEPKLMEAQRRLYRYCPEAEDAPDARTTLAAAPGLPADLFRLLLRLADSGLPLTAKGLPHKGMLKRSVAGLGLDDRHVAGLGLRSAYPADYPLPALVLLDLLLTLGLVRREGERWIPDRAGVEAWLALDENAMRRRVLEATLFRYGGPGPAGQHFRCALGNGGWTPGRWYRLSRLLDGLEGAGLAGEWTAGPPGAGEASLSGHSGGRNGSAGPPGSVRTAVMGRERREAEAAGWLAWLAGVGLLSLGRSEADGGLCFRWCLSYPDSMYSDSASPDPALPDSEFPHSATPASSPSWALIVQPDLEVLVPPQTPFRARWALASCLAEPETLESGLWSFRLTRGRLEAAAAAGLPPAEAAAWLDRHAAGGLPPGVRAVLQQWAAGFGRTRIREMQVLACRDLGDAEALAGHPRLADCLVRLGPLHFGVLPDRLPPLLRELAAAGLAPPSGGGAESVPEPELFRLEPPPGAAPGGGEGAPDTAARPGSPGGGEAPAGLFPPSRGLGEPAAAPGPAAELWPDRDRVPAMWLRERRRYHAATSRSVMEQALRWGVKVTLTVGGAERLFVPERIAPGRWRVSGYFVEEGVPEPEAAELAAEDWTEIGIVLPESRFSSSAGRGDMV